MPKKQKKKQNKEKSLVWCDVCCQWISLINNPSGIHTCYDYRANERAEFEDELASHIAYRKEFFTSVYRD